MFCEDKIGDARRRFVPDKNGFLYYIR